jgi:hypothetical protein
LLVVRIRKSEYRDKFAKGLLPACAVVLSQACLKKTD